jgi:hypothetical protein
VDRPQLQALLEERALAHDAMDASRVARVREEMGGCQVKCVTFFIPARAPQTESQTD